MSTKTQIKRTYAIALGGIIAALSITLIFFAAIFPLADLTLTAIAGILLIAAVYEVGEGWAFLIFAAVGILSLLLPSGKNAAIYYILFLGHYPVLKSYIERIKNKPLNWAVKLVIFNVCAALTFFVGIKLLGLPNDILKYGYIVAALLLNVAFVIYDIAVSRLIVLYAVRLRKIIGRR